MKRIIITLIWTLAFLVTIAQTNENSIEHMTFKGVPIDGTLSEYVSKMKQSGFTLFESEDGVAMLKGDFAAYKDCIIGVATLKGKDLVSKITVIFPEQETWSSLSSNYYYLKELLTEKYGEPSEIVEKFETYSEPDDDRERMYAVKTDKYKYYTTYELKNGTIQIKIDHQQGISCFIRLTYFDKINGEIIRQKALDDL